MKKKIEQIMGFIKGQPQRKKITYINGVIDMGEGCKIGTDNVEFANKFIAYFQRLRDNY